MGLPDYGKAGKVPPRDPRFDKQTAPARSLNEAWLDALDRCAADTPLNEVHLSSDAHLLFLWGDARRFLAGERSWQSTGCRYRRLPQGKRRGRDCPGFTRARSAPGDPAKR